MVRIERVQRHALLNAYGRGRCGFGSLLVDFDERLMENPSDEHRFRAVHTGKVGAGTERVADAQLQCTGLYSVLWIVMHRKFYFKPGFSSG